MENTYSTFFLAIHGNCFYYLSTRHWLKDPYSIPGEDKEFCLFLYALIASGILPPPTLVSSEGNLAGEWKAPSTTPSGHYQ